MDNSEWTDEEMSLKRFSRKNPFTVPSGYFEEAGQRILSLVNLDELKSTDPANGFEVPANYFDELSATISSRVNIEVSGEAEHEGFAFPANYFDELTANITARVNIEADTPAEHAGFSMPANYFDTLTGNIQSRIAIADMLNAGDAAFSVPQDYFVSMQEQITARIAVDELLQQKTLEFTVPENYFDTLNRDILSKTVNKHDVIRKTIVRKLFASNTFKYATAACLALIIGAGAFLRENSSSVVVPSHEKTLLHTQLSTIPVDEIKDYLQLHVDGSDNNVIMDNEKTLNAQDLDGELGDYIDVN